MPDIFKGNRRTLPDHMTSAGDQPAWSFTLRAPCTDGTLIEIVIDIHASGSLGVRGCINNLDVAVALIENVRDMVRGYRKRSDGLTVPGHDVSIPGYDVITLQIEGPMQNTAYALECLSCAEKAVRDMHARRVTLGARSQVQL